MRLPVLLALALVCSSSTVLAGATDWQELAPNTRLRLIASESRSADGKTLVALELEMPQSTKTYWRVPGESGIPTEISLKGSDGVTGYRFIWPFPIVEQQDGLIDFVYRGPTVIPIELEVGTGTAVVEASVIMGVCSDICIPNLQNGNDCAFICARTWAEGVSAGSSTLACCTDRAPL